MKQLTPEQMAERKSLRRESNELDIISQRQDKVTFDLLHTALMVKPKGRAGWKQFKETWVKTPDEKVVYRGVRALVSGVINRSPEGRLTLSRLEHMAFDGQQYREIEKNIHEASGLIRLICGNCELLNR